MVLCILNKAICIMGYILHFHSNTACQVSTFVFTTIAANFWLYANDYTLPADMHKKGQCTDTDTERGNYQPTLTRINL